MNALASATVGAAILLTPAHLRERYREQWRADLRDADEAGVPTADIARAALVVAITAERSRRVPSITLAEGGDIRARVAVACGAIAAVLALSDSVNLFVGGAAPGRIGIALLAVQNVLLVGEIVAAALALRMAFGAGVALRIRIGVVLVAFAAAMPLARAALVGSRATTGSIFTITHADIAFPMGASSSVLFASGLVCAMVGGGLLARSWHVGSVTTRHGRRPTAIAAAIAAVVGVIPLADLVVAADAGPRGSVPRDDLCAVWGYGPGWAEPAALALLALAAGVAVFGPLVVSLFARESLIGGTAARAVAVIGSLWLIDAAVIAAAGRLQCTFPASLAFHGNTALLATSAARVAWIVVLVMAWRRASHPSRTLAPALTPGASSS